MSCHQERPVLSPKRRQSWFTKMRAVYALRRPLTFFDFFFQISYSEKESLHKITRRSLVDEYKIEDMMIIVKSLWLDEINCAWQDLVQGSPECPSSHHPLLATLELIKTQELIRARGRWVLEISISHEKKKVKCLKARLDREEDEYYKRSALVFLSGEDGIHHS